VRQHRFPRTRTRTRLRRVGAHRATSPARRIASPSSSSSIARSATGVEDLARPPVRTCR
jgi:hypothetical protein